MATSGLKDEGGAEAKAWESAEVAGGIDSSSQVATMVPPASRPCSLTYTSHGWPGKSCNCAILTFHNDVLLSKNLSAWFDSIKCVLHEFRT